MFLILMRFGRYVGGIYRHRGFNFLLRIFHLIVKHLCKKKRNNVKYMCYCIVSRYRRITLKNDWLKSPPINLLKTLFCMMGFPPSKSAIPSSTASTNMLGECTLLITNSTTRSEAPSRSR